MLMPEYLVVCCWRSVKEISLILGQLTKDVPVETNDGDDQNGLLTQRQVSDCKTAITEKAASFNDRALHKMTCCRLWKMVLLLKKLFRQNTVKCSHGSNK